MVVRQIIKIDEEKCNGCGACVTACHEGAIGMVNGKATLLRDDYCDGLGDCLPSCPTGAITFENRKALAYDDAAVQANMAAKKKEFSFGGGCPGSAAKTLQENIECDCNTKGAKLFERNEGSGCQSAKAEMLKENIECDCHTKGAKLVEHKHGGGGCQSAMSRTINTDKEDNKVVNFEVRSELRQWPVQIKLVPVNAPYFNNANLLVAADCCAYAYGNFHNEFMKNKITIIGCPKLDSVEYSEKLAEIIRTNNIKSVTVARMEVPCCGGMENAVIKALKASGKFIPWQVVTISNDGRILN